MKKALGFVAVLVLGSCNSTVATQYIVRVSADAPLVAEARRLRVVIRSPDGAVRLDTIASIGTTADVSLPTDVPVGPLGGDASRGFFFDATLLNAMDEPIVTKGFYSRGYVAGHVHVLELHLEAACRNVRCASIDTCIGGSCAPAVVEPGQQLVSDGSMSPRACTDSMCFEHPLPTGHRASDVCMYGDTSGFVVGGTGDIIHLDDGVVRVERPSIVGARTVHCWPSGEAIVVGNAGVSERNAEGVWTLTGSTLGRNFSDVWGASPEDVWLVGHGILMRREGRGTAFAEVSGSPLQPDEPLNAIAGTSPDNVWFAGGSVFSWNGREFGAPLPQALYAGSPGEFDVPQTIAITPGGNPIVSQGFADFAAEWNGSEWLRAGFPGGCHGLAASGSAITCTGQRGRVNRLEGDGTREELPPFLQSDFLSGQTLKCASWQGNSLFAGRFGLLAHWSSDGTAGLFGQRQSVGALRDVESGRGLTIAVGDQNTILEREPGGVWSRRELVSDEPLRLLSVDVSDSLVVAVGSVLLVGFQAGPGRIAERSSEGVWALVPSPTSSSLLSVDGGLVGGRDGILLRRSEVGWELHPASSPELGDVRAVHVYNGAAWIGTSTGAIYEVQADLSLRHAVTLAYPIDRFRSSAAGVFVQAHDDSGGYRCRLSESACVPIRGVPADRRSQDFLVDEEGPSHVLDVELRTRRTGWESVSVPVVSVLGRDPLGNTLLVGGGATIIRLLED